MAEALRGRRAVRSILVARGIKEDGRIPEIIGAAVHGDIPLDRVERQLLDELTHGAHHQGVAAEVGPFPYVSLDEITAAPGTVLVLDHLQDPQNFGTLLRAAEAANVRGVVIPLDRAVEVTPAVVNASAGAVEHLRIAQVPNLVRGLTTLRDAGWWSIGLDTGPGAVDLFSGVLPDPAALVVGAEGSGISPLLRKHCDVIAEIPMAGQVASLNAATAGAIALFELVRRHRLSG